jgi:hypothetical protein
VTVLVVVGIAVAVFGALVLLRFPDRPGGKIAWRGFEVSSVGAGLPLIALGVAALALASFRGEDGDSDAAGLGGEPSAGSTSTADDSATAPTGTRGRDCLALDDIPSERTDELGTGVIDKKVISGGETLDGPIGLVLEDRGSPVGAVRMSYDADGAPFYPEGIVSADCAELPPEAYASTDDGDGDPQTWGPYDDICIDFGAGQNYVLELGSGADITVGFRRSPCSPS